MSSTFKLDASSLIKGMEHFYGKADAALFLYTQTAALKLQNYMRDNAPWTDRTGHARQRLTGVASTKKGGYLITLAQGVDYGIWLELAHEKRFAIIQPTILAKSEEVMRGFNKLLERL